MYAFGPFTLDPARRQLSKGNTPLPVGRRAFDLLLTLIEQRDRILTKDDLLRQVWGKAVEDNNLTVTMSALRRTLGNDPNGPRYICTLPGLGYQFVGTLQAVANGDAQPAAPIPSPSPEMPAIAVLPFRHMSDDQTQAHFAHGLAEDITAALSRNRWLTVIASKSTATFPAMVDPREIARELNVHYVLEGSFRIAGDRVRVSTRLIEGATGRHLTSERYDRALSSIFDVQDEITLSIISEVRPVLYEAEQARSLRRHPDSLDAWAAYQRGVREFSSSDRTSGRSAQAWFERAIALDANFAPGYYGLALFHLHGGSAFLPSAAPDWQTLGEALAARAIDLDPRDSGAHSIIGLARMLRGDHEAALEATAQALTLNPSDATAHGTRGATLVFCGRPLEGLQSLHLSVRLSPRDPRLHVRHAHMALGHYFARQYDEALATAKAMSERWPAYFFTPRLVAMVLAERGDIAGARAALRSARLLAGAPYDDFSRDRMPWYGDAAYARAEAALIFGGSAGLWCMDHRRVGWGRMRQGSFSPLCG